MTRKARVGVLMGGLSAEREVSLLSGATVVKALERLGYPVAPIEADGQTLGRLQNAEVDLVFNALHGRYGEDGCIQGLLEIVGIPYTGSGVLASALAMNKLKAKELFRLHNLPTPPYYALQREQLDRLEELHGSFGFPVVAKPAGEGSSLGVSRAEDLVQLREACELALLLDETVLIERYIDGDEVCVGIVNGQPLGAMSIVSHNEIFDYQAKYCAGHAHYHIPARLSPERYRGVLTQALRAHQALGCTGATRVDMMVSSLGNEYILELNTLPGLTPQSLLPRLARHQEVSYDTLVESILLDARLHGGQARSPELGAPSATRRVFAAS